MHKRTSGPKRSAAPILWGLAAAFIFNLAPPDAGSAPSPSPAERKKIGAEYFYKRRVLRDGTFPSEARQRGLEAMRKLPISPMQTMGGRGGMTTQAVSPSQQITNTWTSLGPRPLVEKGYGFGNAAGRVNAIAVDPTDHNIVYLATAFSGVAKSTDGGTHWNYLTHALPSQSISSILIDTTAPNIIYAGTGDPYYTGHGVTLLGVGVYRSTDSGATWGQFGGSYNLGGGVVRQLALDQRTSGSQTSATLYAAVTHGTNPGFWRSTNSGQTWTSLISGTGCYDVVIDTNSPSTVYRACDSGIWRSDDSAGNWSQILANPDADKSRLAISSGALYVGLSTGSYQSAVFGADAKGELYKSTNSGASWTVLPAANGFCATQCDTSMVVAVDPSSTSHLFVGGSDAALSTNTGLNFSTYTSFNPPNMIMHSEQHALAFSRSSTGTIYAATAGGVYKSLNSGLTWSNLNANLNGNLTIGVSAGGHGKMIAGFQDNGSSTFTNTAAPRWDMLSLTGDGGFNKIDPGNSQKMYFTYNTVGNVEAGLLHRTTDGGASSTTITPAAAVGTEGSLFYPPLFMDPEDSTRLLFGGEHVYRSADSGTSWTRIGAAGQPDSTNRISALFEAPSDTKTIYAGTESGRVYVTANADLGNAATWTQVTSGLPSAQLPTAFAVDPTNASLAYVTFSQYGTTASPFLHVYKTTSKGASWTSASAGLPDVPFNDIVLDTATPDNLFAASDVGLYNSMDAGTTWARSSIGIPEGLIINSLSLNSGTLELVAGTYGMGVYRLYLPQVASAPAGFTSAALGVSSITWTWTAQSRAVSYKVLNSADAVLIASGTSVLNSSYTWTGRSSSTLYGILVYATDVHGTDSPAGLAPYTATLADPVGASTATPHISSITVVFSSVTLCSGYTAQASTASDFSGTLFSSATSNAASLQLVITGLSPATTYYLRLGSLNPSSAANYIMVSSTLTDTNLATPGQSPFSSITTGTIRFNWLQSTNPDGTTYQASASTTSQFIGGADVAVSTTDFSVLFTGLTPNTSYYFKVRAVGGPILSTGPVATTALAPSSASVAYPSLGTADLTLAWGANGNSSGSWYEAQISSFADFSNANSSGTRNASANFSGLPANTTFYARVRTVGHNGTASDYLSISATSTLAAVLTIPVSSFTGVSAAGLTAIFDNPSNPVGTSYLALLSTAADYSVINSSASGAIVAASGNTAVFTGLLSNQTHYFRIAAVNHNGVASAFTSSASTATIPSPPTSASPSASNVTTSLMRLSWNGSANAPGTQYTAEASSHSNFSSGVQSFTGINTYADLTGLWPNTTYFLRVKALSLAPPNPDSAWAELTGGSPLAEAPAAAAQPFYTVTYTSITVRWTPLAVSPSSKSAQGYKVELSTDSGFNGTVVSSAVAGVESFQASFTGLSHSTTYYLRVGSLNWNSLPNYAATISTLTLIPVLSSATVNNQQPISVSVVPPYAQIRSIRVDVPVGTFPSNSLLVVNTNVELDLPAEGSNQASMRQLGTGVGLSISAGGAQPQRPVTITMGYDLPVGTDPRLLALGRYDEDARQWVLLPSSVDTASGTVTGVTNHFSYFSPFLVTPGAGLSAVNIFPIPWEPGSDNPLFNAATLSFTNLPANARLRIYSITGELIWKGEAAASGTWNWTGENYKGKRVASGTYMALIESGDQRLVKRFVIIR